MIRARFLWEGGQGAESIAELIQSFVEEATGSLEIAIYDLRLQGQGARQVVAALRSAARRGVAVRLLFNQDHRKPIPVPVPPSIDWDLLHRFGVPFHPVSGVPDLMHHKYVVRDAGATHAAVLTGSANWTDDSWSREENVILEIHSAALALQYRSNFEELWASRQVSTSGRPDGGWIGIGARGRVRAFFAPGGARTMVHAIATRIGATRRRLRICSTVLTSGPILTSVAEQLSRPDLDVGGVFDATQMAAVLGRWRAQPERSWKLSLFESVVEGAGLVGKWSIPYCPGSRHNFMHAKLVVVDDAVFAGSYNLSHNGERNAENVVEIEDPLLADQAAEFIDMVAARYAGPARLD